MADSEQADPASGSENPKETPPAQYIQPPSIQSHEPQPPQVITIREPSLSTNLGIALRDWLKSRGRTLQGNLRADVVFCRDAFKATFAEARWAKMRALVTHTHKWLNWLLGLGIPAGIISLYIAFIYSIVGSVGTVIVILSFLLFASLVTIRVTRRLYQKALHGETKEEPSSKVAANDDIGYRRNLIETWRGMIVLAERKYMSGKEPGISFSEIFQRQPAFIQLVPLLSKEAIDALDADVREELARKERERPVALRLLLAKEISRVETELELFPRLVGVTKPVENKLIFEINKANTSVRVEQTASALRVWLDIELRFENKDTYPIGFKRFDISMYRYGIKDRQPGFDIGIQWALVRIMSNGILIPLDGFEGMMIQERRLTPFYRLYFMIDIEDDQIKRAEDLYILDTIRLIMHSSGDQAPLVASLHPHWVIATERDNGTNLISITGVPTIEMDYRRLR